VTGTYLPIRLFASPRNRVGGFVMRAISEFVIIGKSQKLDKRQK